MPTTAVPSAATNGRRTLRRRAAAQCASQNRVRYVNLSRTSFSNNGYYTYNVYLHGGDRARISIAWSANASRFYTSTLLNADLDLTVLAGANATSGTSYGSSSSFNRSLSLISRKPFCVSTPIAMSGSST